MWKTLVLTLAFVSVAGCASSEEDRVPVAAQVPAARPVDDALMTSAVERLRAEVAKNPELAGRGRSMLKARGLSR